ncbi:unnamed protein product [Agarophyton chilense]
MAFAQLAHLPTKVPCVKTDSCQARPSWTASAKPRRVGIAGAGIAGLSTALALIRTPGTGVEQVDIFEPRLDVDSGKGGALNLNGASAILGSVYGVPIQDIGSSLDRVIAREVAGSTLFEVDVGRVLKSSKAATKALSMNGRHSFMAVMREDMLSLLAKEIEHQVTINRGESNRVTGVHQQGSDTHFILKDGTLSDPFDLVIGADGVRSNVRSHVSKQPTEPIYSGIRIQWAIANGSMLPQGHLEQWFGDGVYVLRYSAGSQDKPYEIIASSFRKRESALENEGYEQDKFVRKDFRERLHRSSMPTSVTDVLERSERLIETSVYRQNLPSIWHRGSCCLVGDSAHAMPPYLGQGANQAVQDAHCLALALSKIDMQHGTLSDALESYERIRRVPVQAVLQTSRLVSFFEIQDGKIQSQARNNFFRILGIAGVPGRTLIQAAIPRIS